MSSVTVRPLRLYRTLFRVVLAKSYNFRGEFDCFIKDSHKETVFMHLFNLESKMY